MPIPERPQLHPLVRWERDGDDPGYLVAWNRSGPGAGPLRVSLEAYCWLQLFDGRRTLREIQAEAMRQAGGELLPLEILTSLVEKLDRARMLDGPEFRDLLARPIREPACVGCYKANPDALRRQLRRLFTGAGGSGLPGEARPDGRLCAALIPHIDYDRGGVTYTWGFKEVVEHSDAALFVIIGTSHYSAHRFTLTRKHFKTPLGIAPTDQTYIDRLVAHYGPGLFDDEYLAHLPEHSIELEVVFLQYLYEKRRPIRIVPLVAGSFGDCVAGGNLPVAQDDIGRMVRALRAVEAETPEPICYIISGDLAHIGPKFDDPEPVEEPFLKHSRTQDQSILQQTEKADPTGYYRVIAEEHDCRRICGLPPTYTVLEAVRPSSGKVLHYDQYVHPSGHESVSFASVAFYR
jgi:AmmeMemoRadiSam system protein B